jgi:integrase
MVLSEFEQQFHALKAADIRATTLRRIYQPAFKAFRSVCGDKNLSRYTVMDVELFKSTRLRTCSDTTVSIEFRTLRAALNSAVNWGLLKENPFLKSKNVPVAERLPVFISENEFRRLQAVVDIPVLKDLFLFAALTGLRLGEILNLQWRQVDLQKRTIYVTNSKKFATKSGRSRAVPIGVGDLYGMLLRRATTQDFCEWVFHRAGKQLQQSHVQHRFKRYVRKAGLSEDVRFHSLRHTFATWLLDRGRSLYEIQQLLGHGSIRVTQMYAHLSAEHLRAAVSSLNFGFAEEDAVGQAASGRN